MFLGKILGVFSLKKVLRGYGVLGICVNGIEHQGDHKLSLIERVLFLVITLGKFTLSGDLYA